MNRRILPLARRAVSKEGSVGNLNVLAILVAALATFVIGGLWYSPALFHRPWMKANRFTDADLAGANMGLIFGLAFVFAVVMAFNLAMFLDAPETTLAWGATAGGLTAIWVVLGIGTVALFERRPAAYTLINGGYWVVSLVVMGAIIGGWR
jgi:hypothetical protein